MRCAVPSDGNNFSTIDPDTGQVLSRTDPFGQVTAYSYYPPGGPNAGLLYCQTGPGAKKSYYQYNDRGQLTHKWGNVPYPEQRLYSMFGEMTNLITYRAGTQWTGTNWPANPPPGDRTQWFFDQPTGLLTNKTDAAGNAVLYSYYNNHLLKTKTWARAPAVQVTSRYTPLGELAGWEYSDDTPDVNFTDYNRLGLPRQLTDGAGTHTLAYDHLGRLTSHSHALWPVHGAWLQNFSLSTLVRRGM